MNEIFDGLKTVLDSESIKGLKTPSYVIDEKKLLHNAEVLSSVMSHTGCRILLAQKAFSAYSTYPLIAEYLQGATASGLYEAKLAYEEMVKPFEGKKKIENHVFEPAFKDAEFPLVCEVADHIVFNSIAQLEHHRAVWEKAVSEKEGTAAEEGASEKPAKSISTCRKKYITPGRSIRWGSTAWS